MRTFKHWTPRYIVDRSREIIDQKTNPSNPWLTRDAVRLLNELLRPQDIALEFGGGRSTPWFARRMKQITSVDDNGQWQDFARSKVVAAKLSNVDFVLCPMDVPEERGHESAYVRTLDRFADHSIDFALVDGVYRAHCAVGVLPKLRHGALVAVDNSNWFLPSNSIAPNSRSYAHGPINDVWSSFWEQTSTWRRIWTDSGVTATLLLFKP